MENKTNIRVALTGISGILVTPFDEKGNIAPELQAAIVEKAIKAGVHILVANGNTGEFYALTMDEAETMVIASAKFINKRVPLLAGIGRGIKDACRLARVSADAGADALMIHQPPDPFSAPRGYVDYVKAVIKASGGLPTVLYMRNDAIGINIIQELCAIKEVVGVKWATTNPLALAKAIDATDDSIVWVGGLAETWAPSFYAVGARGFTSGLINIWPEQSMKIHAALEAGDYPKANELIAQMEPFEAIRAEELNGANVTGVKAALQAIGHNCGPTRPPSAWPLTEKQSAKLDGFISNQNIKF